ncbi:MAG: hypothetical protein HY537_01580 [Deltaproteobacteria bacterium]|nr:hypothetical protein [Deltaproteobacteria bacterium]
MATQKKEKEKPVKTEAKKTASPATKKKVETKPAEKTPKPSPASQPALSEAVDKPKKKMASAKTKPSPPRAHKCRVGSCKRAYRAKGYCASHYRKWRRGEYGKARYKICHAMDCRRAMVQNRHGYCDDHYQNFYVKGIKTPKPVAAKPEQKETPVKEPTAAAS